MKEDDKKMVNVHSSAIHIENKVGLKARLAWFYMLYKAFPVLNSQNYFTITIGELKKAIGYTSKNNTSLKSSLEELARTEIQWNIFGKDGHEWGISHLLSECRIKTDSNIIYYEYSSFVKEKLSNPEMYVKINLLVSKTFKSKHSLSLYCLALDYLYIKNNYGEKNISLENIRKYLGLESHEYIKPGDLYIHILQKAEEEINNSSDLNFKVEAVRGERNKILGFKFQMSIKDEFLEIYKPQKLIKEKINVDHQIKQINLFDDLETPEVKVIEGFKSSIQKIKIQDLVLKKYFSENKISITTNTVQAKLSEIQKTFQDKFEDYLIFLMKYTNQEANRKNINNLSGFYVGLLKDDSQLDNYLFYQEQQRQSQIEKDKIIDRHIKVELDGMYDNYLSSDFHNYILDNINSIKNKIIKYVEQNILPETFIYDVIIKKQMDSEFSIEGFMNLSNSYQLPFINQFKENPSYFNYKTMTYEEWESKYVSEQSLQKVREKILSSKMF